MNEDAVNPDQVPFDSDVEQIVGWREAVKWLKTSDPINVLVVRQMAELRQIVRRMKLSNTTVLDPIVAAKLARAFDN